MTTETRETGTTPELSTAEHLQMRSAALTLQRRWQGQLNVETIERFMTESLEVLLPKARVTTWLPVLVERLTNDRLQALVRLESDRTDLNPSVLFLCVHNAGRSQMAAGLMRHLAGDRVNVYSGGSGPGRCDQPRGGGRHGRAGDRHEPASSPSRGRTRSCVRRT